MSSELPKYKDKKSMKRVYDCEDSVTDLKKRLCIAKNEVGKLNNAICDTMFEKHFKCLNIDLNFLEKNFLCDFVICSKTDEKIVFHCVFTGKLSTLTFQYEDGWFCKYLNLIDQSETIISECKSIDDFCNDIVETLE